MRISESRLSGLYFFLVFLALILGFSLYKSFYAVVSPKNLQEVLRARLEKEVELYDLQVEVVDFNFFHGIFFKPGLAWKGFHIAYSKNCNFIEANSPDIYFAVDLTRLFRRRLELEEVIANQLEIKIIKDYACENLDKTQQDRSVAQIGNPINSDIPSVPEDLAFVKNLPDFRLGELKLYTERNLTRYMIFKNVQVIEKKSAYQVQSDVSFSEALNVGNLPTLKINGSFDEKQNIRLSSRLREAKMDFWVEPLGDKNFKTTFTVTDFPLQYVINILKDRFPRLHQLDPLASQWIHIKTHTVSYWDDFFDKNLILYVEDFRLTGDTVKLSAEPFQLRLEERQLVSTAKMKVDMLSVKPILPFIFIPEISNILLQPGIVSGSLQVDRNHEVQLEGLWKNAVLYTEMYGLKKGFEVLPTRFSFENNKEGQFLTTKDLALRNVGGNLDFSILTSNEKTSAKLVANNVVSAETWLKLFNASIDFVDVDLNFVFEDTLQWEGKAKFRGFNGKQFSAKSGTLKLQRDTVNETVNADLREIELVRSSYLQSWIQGIFENKLTPFTLSEWKWQQVSDVRRGKSLQKMEFIGSKPNFLLDLEQKKEEEFNILRAQPKTKNNVVPKQATTL